MFEVETCTGFTSVQVTLMMSSTFSYNNLFNSMPVALASIKKWFDINLLTLNLPWFDWFYFATHALFLKVVYGKNSKWSINSCIAIFIVILNPLTDTYWLR